jgi:hypothetical protein
MFYKNKKEKLIKSYITNSEKNTGNEMSIPTV